MKKDFPNLPKPIAQALAKEEIFTKALFARPESLSALLPYDEFIDSLGMFRNKDGSLGVVFEAELLEHEALAGEKIVSSVESLKSWFILPENCTLQILFEQSPISERDELFDKFTSHYKDAHSVSKTLFQARLAQLRSACNSDSELRPLRRKTVISIRYFPGFADSRLAKDILKRGEAILFREMKGFIQESRTFAQIIGDFQHNSKIPLRRLDASEVLDLLRRFFNPKTYYKRKFASYNSNLPISDQLIYHSPVLDYPGIEREGVKTRTLSLKTSPKYAYPGGMAYFTRLKFPFKLSLNFSFPSKAKSKTFFDMKEFFLQNTPSARAKRQREEILEIQERLALEDRCLHLTFNVIVEGETDEILDTRVREIVNVFHNDLECETITEEDIGLGLCLNSLPLNYHPKADYSTRRAIRILRSHATKFVPVFDSFRGLKNPLQVYLSRENNIVPFSLLENETSNHTVVLADSGSGKSAFIIDCIQAAKRMNENALVFVIDKKSSYTMFSEYFDGDLTVFERNKDMPFSAFRGVYDEEKIAFLTNYIASCVKLTNPSFEIGGAHTSAISRALKLAYEKKVELAKIAYVESEIRSKGLDTDVTLSMDDFISELSALPSDPHFEPMLIEIESLIQKLTPFYGDGIYSQYFRDKTAPKRAKKKTCFIYDLDALDSDPILQALITTAVFEEIRQTILRPENQGQSGFIVLEELGRLGENPVASKIIVDFAETMRKLGFWLISLTPQPKNYFELEAGKAMWGVADNFIFLQMSDDNVKYVAQHSELLDGATQEIVKSLRTKRGHHADVFFINKKKTSLGAFRYFQTGFDRWLSPTNAKDASVAKDALKKFKAHKWQALEYLALTYPQGVESSQTTNQTVNERISKE